MKTLFVALIVMFHLLGSFLQGEVRGKQRAQVPLHISLLKQHYFTPAHSKPPPVASFFVPSTTPWSSRLQMINNAVAATLAEVNLSPVERRVALALRHAAQIVDHRKKNGGDSTFSLPPPPPELSQEFQTFAQDTSALATCENLVDLEWTMQERGEGTEVLVPAFIYLSIKGGAASAISFMKRIGCHTGLCWGLFMCVPEDVESKTTLLKWYQESGPGETHHTSFGRALSTFLLDTTEKSAEKLTETASRKGVCSEEQLLIICAAASTAFNSWDRREKYKDIVLPLLITYGYQNENYLKIFASRFDCSEWTVMQPLYDLHRSIQDWINGTTTSSIATLFERWEKLDGPLKGCFGGSQKSFELLTKMLDEIAEVCRTHEKAAYTAETMRKIVNIVFGVGDGCELADHLSILIRPDIMLDVLTGLLGDPREHPQPQFRRLHDELLRARRTYEEDYDVAVSRISGDVDSPVASSSTARPSSVKSMSMSTIDTPAFTRPDANDTSFGDDFFVESPLPVRKGPLKSANGPSEVCRPSRHDMNRPLTSPVSSQSVALPMSRLRVTSTPIRSSGWQTGRSFGYDFFGDSPSLRHVNGPARRLRRPSPVTARPSTSSNTNGSIDESGLPESVAPGQGTEEPRNAEMETTRDADSDGSFDMMDEPTEVEKESTSHQRRSTTRPVKKEDGRKTSTSGGNQKSSGDDQQGRVEQMRRISPNGQWSEPARLVWALAIDPIPPSHHEYRLQQLYELLIRVVNPTLSSSARYPVLNATKSNRREIETKKSALAKVRDELKGTILACRMMRKEGDKKDVVYAKLMDCPVHIGKDGKLHSGNMVI